MMYGHRQVMSISPAPRQSIWPGECCRGRHGQLMPGRCRLPAGGGCATRAGGHRRAVLWRRSRGRPHGLPLIMARSALVECAASHGSCA
jgi:hypothetical protein